MKTIAILAAAGRGERLGQQKSKLWADVSGKPLIYYSLGCIERATAVDGILLMAPSEDIAPLNDAIREWRFKKVKEILAGGERRQDTVRIGLDSLPQDCDIVVIHDAARPMASPALFTRVIAAAKRAGAASAAVQPVDTIVEIRGQGEIRGHKPNSAAELSIVSPNFKYLDRSALRQIQTPQAFKVKVIREAHNRALKEGVTGTDDAGLVLRLEQKVELVEGEPGNFKVTYPDDLKRLEQSL